MRRVGRKIRRVAIVTGSRAEYGILRPVIRELQRRGLALRLIVAGMHLRPEYGFTCRQIEADGLAISAKVEMAVPGDDAHKMAHAIGLGVCGFAKALDELVPDAVVVLGDRTEAFAAAIATAGSHRLLVHIHGGEVTRGGLDESMRHGITKLAHLHFTATAEARLRIIQMGERPDRVFMVGAPGIDAILKEKPLPLAKLESSLGFAIRRPLVVLAQHPVSTRADAASSEIRETLEALAKTRYQTVCVYPNCDAGGQRMISVIELYRGQPWLHISPSLAHLTYLSLLRTADVLVGNTSSGIIEAPSLRLPVVNIGDRQNGRERGQNILDVPAEREAIARAIKRALTDKVFLRRVRKEGNPYGSGNASVKIAQKLAQIRLNRDLIQKQFYS